MKPSQFAAQLTKKIEGKIAPNRIYDRVTLEAIGMLIVRRVKDLILKGESPIESKGKFPAYKNPEKYPGKRKPHRPVNLTLSGDMLNALRYRINQAKVLVTILYQDKKSKLKELGHREGANKQPRRPTIPQAQERFRKTIMQDAQAIADRALKRAIAALKS